MADTEFQQLQKIQSSGGLNPVQKTRYDQLAADPSQSNPMQGAIQSLSPESVVKSAQSINDFYKTANQPAIQAQQATIAPLEQKYKDLLDSIKGNQQVATNQQTIATNNELGKRGLTADSGLSQQTLASALLPVNTQFTQLQKDTVNNENMDIAGINAAIAKLMTGNPESSLSAASGLASSQQSADQFSRQLALQQAAQDLQRQQYSDSRSSTGIDDALKQLQLQFGVQSNPLQLQLLQAQINKANQSNNQPSTSLTDLLSQFGG